MTYRSAIFKEGKLAGLSDKESIAVVKYYDSRFGDADPIVPPSSLFVVLREEMLANVEKYADPRDAQDILDDWKSRGRSRIGGIRSDSGREQNDGHDAAVNYAVDFDPNYVNYHQKIHENMLRQNNNRDRPATSNHLRPGEFCFAKRKLGGEGIPWYRISQNKHDRDDCFESSTGEAIQPQTPRGFNMGDLHAAASQRLKNR